MSGKYKRDVQKARADYRRSVLARYRRIVGCVDCGYNENADALEFDHLPGYEKDRTIASMMYASWGAIKTEMRKCEVVCANCHAIRTRQRERSLA